MRIINLTPHALNLVTGEGTVTIPPSGTIARVSVNRTQIGTVSIDGVTVPLNRSQYGEVVDLPDPAEDTLYVVSALVAAACPERSDLVVPDDLVRDEQGRVIGARALTFPA